MSRRTRFGLWVALVVVALVAPAMGALTSLSVEVVALVRCVALSGFLWLLATTPTGAIKLPRLWSVAIVGAGAGWLGWFVLAPFPAAVLALFASGASWVVGTQRLGSRSAWWIAPFVWHPAISGVTRVDDGAAVALAALVGAGVSVALSGARGLGVRPLAWGLWAVACAFTVLTGRV